MNEGHEAIYLSWQSIRNKLKFVLAFSVICQPAVFVFLSCDEHAILAQRIVGGAVDEGFKQYRIYRTLLVWSWLMAAAAGSRIAVARHWRNHSHSLMASGTHNGLDGGLVASGGAWWGAGDVSIDRVKAWEVSTLFCFCAGVPILAEVLASSLPPSWTKTI